MRVAELDEVTYDLEIDGEQVRRTLHRRVWERGAWATVAIAYEERRPDGGWKPARLAMIRLQRVRDAWKQHAAITLRGSDALGLAQALGEWQGAFGAAGAGDSAGDPADSAGDPADSAGDPADSAGNPADSIEAPGSPEALDGPDA